jgi:hypothetical protein
MRRLAAPTLLVALAIAAGCGSDDEDNTPVACLEGARTYLDALEQAPQAVRLGGEVPISDCLVPNQSAGDLTTIGSTMLDVATQLNSEARRDPGGTATVQLGYLAGALEKGAEDTQGIHSELRRRIEAAALYGPAGKPPPEPFDHAYRKGYAAGRADG